MDLKQLVQTQSKLLDQRDLEVDALCQQAYHLIAETEAGGFADKQAIKQAMQIFAKAIRQYRTALEPYVGLAYLAILLNQDQIASKCLSTVLHLCPDHSDALRLQQYLNGESVELESLSSQSADQKYDQVEIELFNLNCFLQEHLIPRANHQEETQTVLKTLQEELRQKMYWTENELQQLEDFFDTSSLRRRLKPAEKYVSLCQQRLELCLEMHATHQFIQNMLYTLRSLHGLKIYTEDEEKELEQLSDQTEQMGSRLKDFAQRGGETETVTHHYQILQAVLEQIQENLETPSA